MTKKLLENIINAYVKSFIFEGKYEDALNFNPQLQTELDFLRSHNIHPRYIDWVVKQLKNKNQKLYLKLEFIVKNLNTFEKYVKKGYIQKADINQYVDFQELSDANFKAYQHEQEIIKAKQKQQSVVKVFENEKYLVLQPLTVEASCKYGKGTKWCISGDNENMFDEYTEGGDTFLFIFNKIDKRKDAISLESDGSIYLWDETNNSIPYFDAQKIWPEDYIQDIISQFIGDDTLWEI